MPLHQHEEEQETGHREPLLRVGVLIDVSGLIVEELPECQGGEGRNWGIFAHTPRGQPPAAERRLQEFAAAQKSARLITAGVCSDLPKRHSPLVPAAAPNRSTADARMIAGRRSKRSRNAKKPIQPGKNVGRQCCSRAVFALGDGLVQQCADFLANDIARPTALAQSGKRIFRRASSGAAIADHPWKYPFEVVSRCCSLAAMRKFTCG